LPISVVRIVPSSLSHGLHSKFTGTFAAYAEYCALMLPEKCGTAAENSGTLARASAAGNRPRPPPEGVAGFSSTARPLLAVLM
jgi:hypothetical protein